MSTTNIDGISAIHCVITDACHKHHGGKGASFQEAVDRVRKQYFQSVEGWGETEGVDYHLVLTVDSPRHKQMREDAKARCSVCNGRRELLDDAGGTWACPACNVVKPENAEITPGFCVKKCFSCGFEKQVGTNARKCESCGVDDAMFLSRYVDGPERRERCTACGRPRQECRGKNVCGLCEHGNGPEPLPMRAG